MIESRDQGGEKPVQILEIDQETLPVQRFAFDHDLDPVIMAVVPRAGALVVPERMGGAEVGGFLNLVHAGTSTRRNVFGAESYQTSGQGSGHPL